MQMTTTFEPSIDKHFSRVRQSGLGMVDTCFTGKTGEVEALKNSSKKTI
jgi:hypothetical protein